MTVHIENKNRSPSEGGFFLRFFLHYTSCVTNMDVQVSMNTANDLHLR